MMSDYFAAADPKRRKYMVGAKRYNAAREVLGRAPEWHELMGADGTLLSPDELRAESAHARSLRVARAEAEIMRNREALRQTAAYGALA